MHTFPQRLSRSQTIASVIAQYAVRNPNRPAIVGMQFAPLSFRELDLWIAEIRGQLRAAGIGPHSRVGVILPPGPESAILGIAIASHATSVPLNPSRPEREIEEELARARLDAVILPSWGDSPAFAIAQRMSFGLFAASRAAGSLSSVALRPLREISRPPSAVGLSVAQRTAIERIAADFGLNPRLDSIALIFTTSGTTGTAKLVPVTHENLVVTADKMRHWFNLSSDDRTAFVLPGYYGAAIKISLLAPILLGGSVALPSARHAQDLDKWIPDLCPTWLWGNPTFFQAVLDRLRSGAGMKLAHSLRFVVSGTAYLPPTLRAELEETLGVPVLQSYGMSEAGILAADPAPPLKRKPGTVGLISREELTIVSPTGELLPDGQVGEIVVHGPTVSPNIWADAEAQDSKDRRLYTGDLGCIDSDGYLTVVGRTKELINRGGEKISPYEVEKALLLHPSVKEAAAFSIPHRRLGENVAAAVVLKAEANPSTEDIKTFLADYLAPFKIPQHVFFVTELPKGAIGKISRSELSVAMAHRVRHVAPPESALEILIVDIWRSLLHCDDVGIDDDFFELGGDSLLAVQMLFHVEALTRRKVSLSTLKAVYTIRQLAATIIRADSTPEKLVACAKQGDGVPFFFFHGEFGVESWASRLVGMLSCNRPVFLARPHPDIKLSIEEMAKAYLPHLLAAQPIGTFRLGGYCNGGLLAWEVAHQLEGLGRGIEFVLLIETFSFNARLPFRMVAGVIKTIAAVAPQRISARLKRDAMLAVWARTKRPVFYGPYLRAMSNYLPPKLGCDVIAVLCDESRGRKEFNTMQWRNFVRKLLRMYIFSTSPWCRLARKIHRRSIVGTHLSAATTNAGELALLLDDILDAGSIDDRNRKDVALLAKEVKRCGPIKRAQWSSMLFKRAVRAALASTGFEVRRIGRPRKGAGAAPDVPHATIQPYATYSPWLIDRTFKEVYAAIGEHTLVDAYRCYELWTLAGRLARQPGDVVEIGVWRGGTGALIAHRVQSVAPDRTVYLCDTFRGVVGRGPRDTGYMGGEHADTSIDTVNELITRMRLNNVRMLVGMFPHETAMQVTANKLALVHIDVDVHDSAKWCFDWAWPRMAPGGAVVFDDYGFYGCEGVTRMVNGIREQDATVIYNLNGHAIVLKTN